MDKLTFKDSKLCATVSRRDDAFWFELKDLVNGITWGEVPLMTFEVHDKPVKRCEVLSKYRIDVFEEVPDGVHIVVGDTWKGISFGLWIRIIDGELSVFLQPMEVYERKADLNRLFSIKLFPGLMSTGKDGSIILPLTSGTLCYPKDKPALSDRFLIYGEQDRWELLPMMPYTAVDTGNGGLMALAVKCAEDTECYVETDGKGNGSTAFGFSLRRWWPDPMDFQNREIRFMPIPPKETAYVYVAKRLRKHIMEYLGKPTLATRAQESPECKYLLDAYIMKMFYAIENDVGPIRKKPGPGVETSPTSFDIVMTFAEAKGHLQKLHDAGIDKIVTEGVGWNPRGHDGMYPTRLPADERLGGQKGWDELTAFGTSLGYDMSVHDNYIDIYKVSPDYDKDLVIWDMFGEPMPWGCWGGGINYRSVGVLMPRERLEGQLEKMKASGIRGQYYVDAMGNPLDVNYHPKNGGPRSQHANGIIKILNAVKSTFGSAATEFGFLYAMPPTDCVASCAYGWNLKKMMPSWPISQLCDRNLPIWHLAMHDLCLAEGHGETWAAVMNKVLLGLHPRTEWSTKPGIHPALDDEMIAALKADYDLTIGAFGHLQTQQIMDFQEPSENVKTSKFEDGTEIVADFKKLELTVNGKNVAKPKGLS